MNKNSKTISELIEEYENHAFYNRYDFLLKSKTTYYIWRENFTDLLKFINKYEKETISRNKKFQDKTLSRAKRRNYLKKFIKLFHNYAAAVYSAEEQCKDFLSSSQYQNIKSEFDKIFNEPLRLFIFALRNNITHHTIPPISISVHHKKRIAKTGDVIFVTKGHFNVKKNVVLSDLYNNNSKFLRDRNKKIILYAHINKQYKNKLSIDLKETIKKHQTLFLKYLKRTNNQIIATDRNGYQEIGKLHKTIIYRQNKI